MSRRQVVSMTAQVASAVSQRAAWFLEQAFPGRHKNKRIAQHFDTSVATAKLLRSGRGWTAERLAAAARDFGWRFVSFVYEPACGGDFAAELAEMEGQLDTLDERANAARRDLQRLRSELVDEEES